MSYSNGEALVLARLREVTNFCATNTSRADWLILNSGASDHYAIVYDGTFEAAFPAAVTRHTEFVTVIEVWQQWTTDADTHANLLTHWTNIVEYLDKYQHLGDATKALSAVVRAGSERQTAWGKGGGPAWLLKEVQVAWTEERSITPSE